MRYAACLPLLLLAAPATAQLGREGPPAPQAPTLDSRGAMPESWRETRDIRDRIDDGRSAGQLDRRSARGLRRETRAIDSAADRYRAGGVSAAEQRELQNRAIVLRDQVNAARTRGTAK